MTREVLPPPDLEGTIGLEQAIAARRSVREFEERPLTGQQLSQLLWATQGITGEEGLRASPSAGGLYPLELYVATRDGLQHYDPQRHALTATVSDDLRPALCRAALNQAAIRHAPAVFLFAAVYARTEATYGEWSGRYVDMELGHAAQNLLLQAVAIGLAGVPIAAFHEERIQRALALPEREEPRYLIPIGKPRGQGAA